MNVYFINPCYLNSETFPVFLEILKIKEAINLCDLKTRNENILKLCRNILIYDRKDTKETDALKQAVYKFNEPMCKPIITDGAFTGKFEIHHLYEKSNANNPIYNLEHCDDKNTLILANEMLDVSNFRNHSFNIINKYDYYDSFNYYMSRICFIKIDSLLRTSFVKNSVAGFQNSIYPLRSWITIDSFIENEILIKRNTSYAYKLFNEKLDSVEYYYNYDYFKSWKLGKEFKSKKDNILKKMFKKKLYNPLVSYINLKSKQVRGDKEFFEYFLSNEGVNARFKAIDEDFISTVKRLSKIDIYYDNDDDCNTNYRTDSEYRYIQNNGGDWIND